MANTKEYQIKINGLTESINAVESLNKQLDNLEQKMKAINSSKVSTGGGSSASRGSNNALSEEERVQKEINKLKEQGQQLDAKIKATQDEIYKRVDATKQLYKETVADQKALAAAERLQADAYSNTMVGMKQHLADLKAVIQTTDLGDSDKIKKMTEQANELTNKLKEMEEAYGQFGRNVGNYKSAAEGFKGLAIQVGDVTREFDNAKQALKELKKERDTLSTKKDLGLASPEEVERLKSLIPVVAQLQSSIQDAGKPMDAIMDTMQSIVAITQAGKGIAAFFGFDSDEINESIQKLVALQNAMQGLQTIQKQLQTQEGIGGWLQKGNAMIDSFIAKITGASKAQQTLTTNIKSTTTATEALTVAEKGQAVATTMATTATKALSIALKSIGIGLIVSAVAYLVTNWKELYKWLSDTVPVLKNIGTWFDKIKAVAMGVGSAVVNFLVQPFATLAKTIQAIITGNFSDIPRILSEGFKKTYNVIGNFQKGYNKEIERQQEAHNQKMNEQQKKANEEWLKDEEAKYGQSHKRTQEYLKKQMALTKKGSEEYKELQRKLWEDERKEREENLKKSNSKSKNSVTDSERELIQARINAMKEGLNKTLTQLEEERKARLAKLKDNSDEYKEWNKYYEDRMLEETEKWAKEVRKIYDDMWMNIKSDSINTWKNIDKLMQTSIENGRVEMQKGYDKIKGQGISSYGVQGKNQLSPMTQFSLGWELTLNQSDFVKDIKLYIDLLRDAQTAENEYMTAKAKFEQEKHNMTDEEIGKENLDLGHLESIYNQKKNILAKYKSDIESVYDSEQIEAARLKLIDENYSSDLSALFKQRISAIEGYWVERIKFETNAINTLASIAKETLDEQYQYDLSANTRHWDEMQAANQAWYDKEVDGIRAQEKKKLITHEKAEQELRDVEKEYNKAAEHIYANYSNDKKTLEGQYAADSTKIENDRINKIKQLNKQAYQDRLQELRDFQTALSDLESKQPVMTRWGFTNLQATYDNNKSLLSGYENMAKKIAEERARANSDKSKGLIDQETYDSTIRDLDRFAAQLGEKMDKVKQEMSLTAQFQVLMGEISQYASQLGSAFNSMLQAFADYTDQQYENAINELEEQIDKMQDLYDKQEEIVSQHKEKLDDIEDELATSRGDRRQHLIDQLNAEMDAQRAALAEQKRIEKEKKALEDKKDKEEFDRKEAQKKMAKTQAVINGATAFMNALAQQPIWLGIALAAMTAAMTAVQVATISSAKYASGGVIEGNSHARGGVDVYGNGRVEVEGGEFITNKRTTSQNVDLLEYINSKKKKVNLDDMIEFYSNGNARKSIVNMSPRKKFAEGGIVPTMSTEYTFDDRLLVAFEDYSNRPVVVSVVDINNKQDQVRRVQTLAGL